MNADRAIGMLASAGSLTERQAEAFVLREVEAVSRNAAAESMGISVNTLDNILGAARRKVTNAEATAEAAEAIRSKELPTHCAECGDVLGARYSDADGEAICLDCAGIDAAGGRF